MAPFRTWNSIIYNYHEIAQKIVIVRSLWRSYEIGTLETPGINYYQTSTPYKSAK